MSKTLHSIGKEKRKKSKDDTVTTESPIEVATEQQLGQKKKTKSQKRALETENQDEQLVIEPNLKKVKLSSNLRPLPKKGNSAKSSSAASRSNLSSVVYLGHIPKGFDEDEIRKFFNQFGKIKRMKLFRSKKTLASKGYAFLEFETEDIATVVADAMNGYYLMERQLTAQQLTKDALHEGMFLQSQEFRLVKKLNRLKQKQSLGNQEEIELLIEDDDSQPDISEENFEEIFEKNQKYIETKQQQLMKKGVDFQIPTVSKTGELIFHVEEALDEVVDDKQKVATESKRVHSSSLATEEQEASIIAEKPKKGKKKVDSKPLAAAGKQEEIIATEVNDKQKKGKKKASLAETEDVKEVVEDVEEAAPKGKKNIKKTRK